jgi:hypothetical protein
MEAEVGPLDFGPLDVAVDYWSAVPNGTMRQLPDFLDQVRLGDVTGGGLAPTSVSELDRLLCGSDTSVVGDPLTISGPSFRTFFAHGVFTVELLRNRKPSSTQRATCPPKGET